MKYYFEGHEILAPVTFESVENVLASESVSQIKFRRKLPSQTWKLTFSVLAKDNIEDLFVNVLDDKYIEKTMVMPQLVSSYNKTSSESNWLVTSVEAAGSTSVAMTSGETNKTISKGTFIQFSNHSKIYVIKETANSDNNTYYDIFPALTTDVNLSTVVYHAKSPTKPSLTYLRDVSNISGIVFSDGILSDAGSITLLESI